VIECESDLQEWALEVAEESLEVPEAALGYIDWEMLARDLMMDYQVYEGPGRTKYLMDACWSWE